MWLIFEHVPIQWWHAKKFEMWSFTSRSSILCAIGSVWNFNDFESYNYLVWIFKNDESILRYQWKSDSFFNESCFIPFHHCVMTSHFLLNLLISGKISSRHFTCFNEINGQNIASSTLLFGDDKIFATSIIVS